MGARSLNPYLDFHQTPTRRVIINPFVFESGGGGGGGVFALVNHIATSDDTTSDATTSDIDTTGANLLIAHVANYDTQTGGVADSKGNVWIPLTPQIPSSGSGIASRLYYCASPIVGAGHNFTVFLGYYGRAMFAAFSGASASPFDVQNGSVNTDPSSIQPGTITPSVDNELIITGMGVRGNCTGPSGFMITDQGFHIAAGGGLAYKIQTAKSSENPTWTHSSGVPAQGQASTIAAFKT